MRAAINNNNLELKKFHGLFEPFWVKNGLLKHILGLAWSFKTHFRSSMVF